MQMMYPGEVNLRNLKLRRDALDKLDLPINVSEGSMHALESLSNMLLTILSYRLLGRTYLDHPMVEFTKRACQSDYRSCILVGRTQERIHCKQLNKLDVCNLTSIDRLLLKRKKSVLKS